MSKRTLSSVRITIGKKGLGFLTRFLKHLFRPAAIILLFPFVIFTHIAVYFYPSYASSFQVINGLPFISYLIALALILLSIIVHEIGHLAACQYFSCEYNSLQFHVPNLFKGWSVNIPSVWGISPLKRVLVDISGMWFQLLLCCFLFILYLLHWSKLSILAIFLINIQLIWGLIPDAKSDGYWLIIDLCEILKRESDAKENCNNPASSRRVTSLRESVNSLPPEDRWKIQSLITGLWILLLAFSVMLFSVAIKLDTSLIKEHVMRLQYVINNHQVLPAIGSLFKIFFGLMVLIALLLCFWRLVKFATTYYAAE